MVSRRDKRKKRPSADGEPFGLQVGSDGVEPAVNFPGGSVSASGEVGIRPSGSSTSYSYSGDSSGSSGGGSSNNDSGGSSSYSSGGGSDY